VFQFSAIIYQELKNVLLVDELMFHPELLDKGRNGYTLEVFSEYG